MKMVWSKEGLREKRPVLLWLLQGALTLILVIGEFEKGKALGKDALLEFPAKRETRSLERLAGPKEDELRSLVFIFDTTGSMHDDWQGAISGGTRILNEFLTYKKRPVSNFILVPFNDPDFGPAMKTENPDTFLNELNKLVIDGGGDCPELSISAIKEALEAAHPHSYLYVFTDASAKDYNRFEEVLKLVQRKHSEVVFFITGDCEESHSEAFLVYEKIAAASYGQMYYLLKKNVNDVLKSVLITTKPNKSNLLVVSSPELDSTNTAQYNLSVESDLKEMIVEVAGDSPEVDIRNPLGNPPDKINIPFDLPNNKFIVIEYPKPAGNWILKVTFHPENVDEYSVENPIITVKGIGTAFDIQHGFSLKPAEGLPATAYRPLEKTENYIYMEVHPTEDNLENKEKLLKYKWTSVDVMKNNGNSYMSLPLTYIMPNNGEEFFPMKYLAGPFIPPDNLFNLAFRGFDESGNPVTRLTSNFISAEEASAPYVKMASEEEGILYKNLVVKCEVESLIPFSLQWYKNGMPFGGKRDFQESSDGSLVIPNIKKEDEGKYECEAKNIRGSDRQFTDVTVIALPEINGMEDIQITVPVGKSVMLNCDVVSDLAYDVKWIYKHDGIEEDLSSVTPIRSNIKILGNNSLSLSTLKKSDSGMYACSASNRAGVTVKEVEINILSPPKITISPDDKFEFIKGESIHINCNVECNSKTKIHWEFNGAEVGPLRERDSDEIIPLTIPSANQDWEGTYTCIAENEAGRVQKEVKGVYVVLPLAKAPNPYVAVKLRQDATLKCSVTGVPPPVIEWTIEDRLIKDGVKHQISSDGSSLRILKSDLHDEGIYKCVASGPRNSKSTAEIKLLLGNPPKPKHLYLNGSLELEKEGSFPCEAEYNAENDLFPGMKTEITWERETGTLDFTRQKILKSGALVIKGAKVTDKGLYICTLRNAFGETRMMFNLAIQGAMSPRIEGDYPEERSFKRGETIVLWCNATGRPQPRIIWSFRANDTSISEELEDGYEEKNSILVKGGKLILYNVNSYYQGIYSCVAKSEAGISPTSKEYNLRLKAPPVLSDDGMPVKATIAEGDSYTFSCTTVGTPKPSFKWIKDNRFAINRNVTGSFSLENDNSILRILSAIPGYHDGTYKCIASNDIGKAVKKFTINVEKARQKNYVI